jgi:hypothetical protein
MMFLTTPFPTVPKPIKPSRTAFIERQSLQGSCVQFLLPDSNGQPPERTRNGAVCPGAAPERPFNPASCLPEAFSVNAFVIDTTGALC